MPSIEWIVMSWPSLTKDNLISMTFQYKMVW